MKKLTFILLGLHSMLLTAQVGMGTVDVDSSALLEVFSTDQGVLFPRLTTAERNLLTNPANGLIIYNTDTDTLEHNSGTSGTPVWDTINTQGAVSSKIAQSAKYSNTDITTDINQTTPGIDLPVFGTEEWNDNTSLYVVSSNQIQVTEAGRFLINVNVSFVSSSTQGRKAPESYIAVNGTQVGTYASTGYIRRNNGHEEASHHLSEVLSLSANDIITVNIQRTGNSNTARLRSIGSSNFYIEKVN